MVDDAMDFLDFEPTGFTRRPIHVRIVSRRNAPANGAVDEEDAMMRCTVTAALSMKKTP